MGDLREPNVAVTEERPVSPSPSPSIGAERWARAEQATRKIIFQVQPTDVSEERRRKVIEYVQRLITGCLGSQVFPYGSVPLKTYLPDGDIDLTAFGGANIEDSLAKDIVSVLEAEDHNPSAQFIVKDVQLIKAEVRLVKCIVQNIAVDISFNQIGGLCTLCFLEQVDRFVGKDHLFKRSIILIKAWCYYESRILGAHHGLISTYALETLVLYIFHVFHSTLDGPLAVLYKFLDYFSKFDWDNYCVSLTGPVRMSSLPEIIAETPENGGGDLLLTHDFLRYCVDHFSVPSKGIDTNSRTFAPKHLNIVDPLKENNNLGRSVSKGNFYRIRSAFTYGARKLGAILMQPEDNIAHELCNFFSNTLDRHGGGQRPDVQDPTPLSNRLGPAFSDSETESSQEEKLIYDSKISNNLDESPNEGVNNNITASVSEIKISRITNGHVLAKPFHPSSSTVFEQQGGPAKGSTLLGCRLSGDAEDLATSKIQPLKISDSSPKVSVEASVAPPAGIALPAPHLYFSNALWSNGTAKDNKKLDTKQSENHVNEGRGVIVNDEVSTTVGSNDVISDWASASSGGTVESMSSLSDLTGDYESHSNFLLIGRLCYEYALNGPALPIPVPLPSHFQPMNSWDQSIHHSAAQYKQNGLSHTGLNGVIPNTVFYPMNPLLIPGVAFGIEEMPKPRGTGTYFPNMSRPPQGYRPSAVKGRNHAPLARSPRNNGRAMMYFDYPVEQGGPAPSSSDIHQSRSPRRRGYPTANGITIQPEGSDFGSAGHVVPLPLGVGVVPLSSSLQQQTNNTTTQAIPPPPPPGMQRPKPVLGIDQDRFMMKSSYQLKDEEDFPPLSGSDCNGK